MKVGDILTLKESVIIGYDHSVASIKLNKGDRLELISISPNNPDFLTLKKEGVSNNIGLKIDNFE